MMMVRVTADIRVEDASAELIDAFTDQLMDALTDRDDAIDPDVSGSLAKGEIALGFHVAAESSSEGQSLGAKILHEVILAAGVDPIGNWMSEPKHSNKGVLPADFLGNHPDLVRRVSTELEPA